MTEQQIEKANNMTLEQIKQERMRAKEIENVCIEGCRHLISRHLMDTSADKPLTCDIQLETDAMGLSDNEKIHVESMFQEPSEGIIYFKYRYYPYLTDIDDVDLDILLEIAEWLEENHT
jgi:hypothetical protein